MGKYDLEIWCVSNKGVRPGTFTIGKKYITQVEDLQVFVIGDNGTEYDWSLIKDLFTTKDKHRDNQLDKLGI